jgi:amino acid transporter
VANSWPLLPSKKAQNTIALPATEQKTPMTTTRKELGLLELVAISLGGMIGGGIFSILGVATELVGSGASLAIAGGGVLAMLAAYSYAQLARYYEDEGATYSFFKRTYPSSHFAASAIGWLVLAGYIATLALYAFTFASYLASLFPDQDPFVLRLMFSAAVLSTFTMLNIVSVKSTGRVEDVLVYSKLVALVIVTLVLFRSSNVSNALPVLESGIHLSSLFVVASITFVAFEGFQLAIHAYEEVEDPRKNVPRAIYASVSIATVLYVLIAEAALRAIPHQQLIAGKEYALAAGTSDILGSWGLGLVIAGALLATSSAISGTLFGASRLMAVIAADGYLPRRLAHRIHGHTPVDALVTLAGLAYVLVAAGGLELILEFGSLTFILVSFLMALANLRIRDKTESSLWMTLAACFGLGGAGVLLLYYQLTTDPFRLCVTATGYGIIALLAWLYARP